MTEEGGETATVIRAEGGYPANATGAGARRSRPPQPIRSREGVKVADAGARCFLRRTQVRGPTPNRTSNLSLTLTLTLTLTLLQTLTLTQHGTSSVGARRR